MKNILNKLRGKNLRIFLFSVFFVVAHSPIETYAADTTKIGPAEKVANSYDSLTIITIFAIFLAPVIAIQAQVYLEQKREKKRGKAQVFITLMATRATPTSAASVEALNRIDIAFHKDKKIKDAWRALLDVYDNFPKDINDGDYSRKLQLSNEKAVEERINLLYEMAQSLKFDFDKVHLKRACYYPAGHNFLENEQSIIRGGLAQILTGNKAFPIFLVNPTNQPPAEGHNEKGPKEIANKS
ncbi:MAG: hypothetical protein HY280_08345 [Nitrospinae bacterium]|nr:hypothetical protein [Nitrospinota bacterium]